LSCDVFKLFLKGSKIGQGQMKLCNDVFFFKNETDNRVNIDRSSALKTTGKTNKMMGCAIKQFVNRQD
jgi:hypothetical protein